MGTNTPTDQIKIKNPNCNKCLWVKTQNIIGDNRFHCPHCGKKKRQDKDQPKKNNRRFCG